MCPKKDFRLEGVGIVLEDLDIYTDYICVVRHRKGDWLVCVVGFSICSKLVSKRERESRGWRHVNVSYFPASKNYGKRDENLKGELLNTEPRHERVTGTSTKAGSGGAAPLISAGRQLFEVPDGTVTRKACHQRALRHSGDSSHLASISRRRPASGHGPLYIYIHTHTHTSSASYSSGAV